MWHVIEHLPDPWAALEAITDRLVPGGVVVLATPNPAALQFRLLGRFWTHVDAPRHLELIPPELLARQLLPLGMRQVLGTTMDRGSLGWNRFGWENSFMNFSQRNLPRKFLGHVGGALGKLLWPLEGQEGWGSAYTAVFQKGEVR